MAPRKQPLHAQLSPFLRGVVFGLFLAGGEGIVVVLCVGVGLVGGCVDLELADILQGGGGLVGGCGRL